MFLAPRTVPSWPTVGEQGCAVPRKPGKKSERNRTEGTEILGNPIPIPESGKMGGVSHLICFPCVLFHTYFFHVARSRAGMPRAPGRPMHQAPRGVPGTSQCLRRRDQVLLRAEGGRSTLQPQVPRLPHGPCGHGMQILTRTLRGLARTGPRRIG